jgi:hypothetical protein
MKAIGRFDFSILAILAIISLAGHVHAQPMANGYARTSTVMVGNEKKFIPWDQLDNTLVEVEGLAWGAFDKGLGEHLKLAQNDEVYLENIGLTNTDLNGRLLNVVGTFRKKRVEKAPSGAQGYGESFDYYSIDVIAARKIDKVEQYQVLPPRGEWIIPGMPIAEALQKVQARKLPAFQQTLLKVQAGSALHPFQVSAKSNLYLGETQGQVASVIEHLPNDPQQQADDQWLVLRGYDLSTMKAAEIPNPPPKKDQLAIPPGGSFR